MEMGELLSLKVYSFIYKIQAGMDLFCMYVHALTHCILVDSSTVICWTSAFVI